MVAKEIADSMKIFDCISFLDDNNPIAVGKLSDFDKYSSEYGSAVVAIGNAEMRLKLIGQLIDAGYDVLVLIHPQAYVSPSAVIGKGSIIEPMAVIHTDVTVGIGCIISAGTIVNHNAVIGNGCHIDCATIIGARARIPNLTKTDYSSVILE